MLGVARRADRLAALAAETGCEVLDVDVTNPASVAALREHVDATGGAHALISNAGLARGLEPIEQANPADWRLMYEVNVLGYQAVVAALLPALRRGALERGVADIVEITSTAGHMVGVGAAGYNASKFAARAVTEVLRLELNGEPIRVIEIAPGMVHTEEFSMVRFGGDQSRADSVYRDVIAPLVADDVAGVIVNAVNQPTHVNLDRIIMMPVAQAAPHVLTRGELKVRDTAP